MKKIGLVWTQCSCFFNKLHIAIPLWRQFSVVLWNILCSHYYIGEWIEGHRGRIVSGMRSVAAVAKTTAEAASNRRYFNAFDIHIVDNSCTALSFFTLFKAALAVVFAIATAERAPWWKNLAKFNKEAQESARIINEIYAFKCVA